MITIAEIEPFQRKVTKLLSIEEKEELISYLSEHPSAGDIIQGTGGIRKLRWARGSKGKSGDLRVREKMFHPILLVFLIGLYVVKRVTYNKYAPLFTPCFRSKILRNIRTKHSFPDPKSYLLFSQ